MDKSFLVKNRTKMYSLVMHVRRNLLCRQKLFWRRAFRKAAITLSLHVVIDGKQAISYLEGTGKYSDRQIHPTQEMILE